VKSIKSVVLEFNFDDGSSMSHRRFTIDGDVSIIEMVKELTRLCNIDKPKDCNTYDSTCNQCGSCSSEEEKIYHEYPNDGIEDEYPCDSCKCYAEDGKDGVCLAEFGRDECIDYTKYLGAENSNDGC
jgi:hypothetical protein